MRLATNSARWPFDADQWQTWLEEPGLKAFFVTLENHDAGHFSLRDRGDDRHLSWLLLRRGIRGGRGREVLALAAQEAAGLGARRLTLNVMRSNPRAFHLYHAAGFTPLQETGGKVTMGRQLT